MPKSGQDTIRGRSVRGVRLPQYPSEDQQLPGSNCAEISSRPSVRSRTRKKLCPAWVNEGNYRPKQKGTSATQHLDPGSRQLLSADRGHWPVEPIRLFAPVCHSSKLAAACHCPSFWKTGSRTTPVRKPGFHAATLWVLLADCGTRIRSRFRRHPKANPPKHARFGFTNRGKGCGGKGFETKHRSAVAANPTILQWRRSGKG